MIKTCQQCNEKFETNVPSKLTCSNICHKERRNSYIKSWNKNNPSKAKATQAKAKSVRKDNGKLYEYQKARRKTMAGYLDRFMERIKVATPDTDIDRDYLASIFKEECSLTNVPFKFNNSLSSFQNPYAPSIDRIDSQKGYFKNNVQIVLVAINLAKNENTMEEFINVWRDISQNWKALTGV